MAKGSFNFRLSPEGWAEFKRTLEEIGPAGKKAIEQITAASPQLETAFQRAAKEVASARKEIEGLGTTGPASLGKLQGAAAALETSAKGAVRVFNDVRGTIAAIAPGAGAAAEGVGRLVGAAGAAVDIFGTLGAVLGRHPLLAVVGVAAAAASAFAALNRETETLAGATSKYADALKLVRDYGAGIIQQSAEFTEAQRANALALLQRRTQSLEDERARLLSARPELGQEPRSLAQRLDRLLTARAPGSPEARLGAIDAELAETRRAEAGVILAEREQRDKADLDQRVRQIKEVAEAEKKANDAAEAALKEKLRLEAAFWAENDKGVQMGLDGLQRLQDAQRRREASLDQFIAKMENEARVSGETNEQREIGRALIEAQNKLLDEQGRKQRDLTDEERARIELAARGRVHADEARKAQEKFAREFERTIEHSTDRAVDLAADTLYDAFTGRIRSIGEFLRATLLRATAQAAAEAVFRPLLQPAIAGAVQSAPGLFGLAAPAGGTPGVLGAANAASSGFSLANTASNIGSLFSLSSLAQGGGILSPFTSIGSAAAGLAGFTVAGPSTIAAASSLAVGPGGLLAGDGATSLAAGSGALLSPLAATGIGAVIAIGAGLLLSSLFKDEDFPFAKARGAVAGARGGARVYATETLDGGDPSALVQGVKAIGDHLKQISQITGARVTQGERFDIVTGRWAGDFSIFAAGRQFSGAPDQAELELLRFYARPEVNTIQGLSATQRRVFAGAPDIEGLLGDLGFATAYDDLAAGTTAFDKALRELNRTMAESAEKTRAYGLDVAVIERERSRATAELVGQAAGQALAPYAPLEQFVNALSAGPGSFLAPREQLANLRGQYGAALARARGGDQAALSDVASLASSIYALDRSYYGISATTVGDASGLLADARGLLGAARETDPIVRAIYTSGAEGAAKVTEALGTVVKRLDDLLDQFTRSAGTPARLLT